MTAFRFFLLTLSAFRLTRLITTDDITESIRDKVSSRFGPDSNWATLIGCGWCAGLYVTAAVFTVDRYLWQPPIWLLAMVAAMALVGYLSTYDER